MMTGSISNVFKIVVFAPGPHAFLTRGRTHIRPGLLSKKYLLELDHTGVSKKE